MEFLIYLLFTGLKLLLQAFKEPDADAAGGVSGVYSSSLFVYFIFLFKLALVRYFFACVVSGL